MFGSHEPTPEQKDLARNPQLLREISNEYADLDGIGSRSFSQKLMDSSPGSPLALCNSAASGKGPSPFANPRKPPLRLLSESDLNNNGILARDSKALLKNSKKQKLPKTLKPRTPRKAKDPAKRKANIEDDFEALQDSKGYWRGLVKLDPNFKHHKLIYDACHGKLDVGVKKAEKKFKDLEDHLFKKQA